MYCNSIILYYDIMYHKVGGTHPFQAVKVFRSSDEAVSFDGVPCSANLS